MCYSCLDFEWLFWFTNDKMNNKLSLDDDSKIGVIDVDKVKIKILDVVVHTLKDMTYVSKI